MSFDLERKIEKRRKSLKLLKKDVYEGLEMTAGGYSDMLKRNSTTVKTLIKLAEILKVDVTYFFIEDEAKAIMENDPEKQALKQQIAKLERDKEFLQSTLSRVLEIRGEGE